MGKLLARYDLLYMGLTNCNFYSDYFIEEDVTDAIEGEHKGRALTRYCRTGSLDRKKRYNIMKTPPDKPRAVAKAQVKVCSSCVRVYCLL